MCETKCVFGVITETWFDNSKSYDWELCDLTHHHHNNLVILGDINLHLNQKDDPLIDVLDQSLSALGLKQHVSEYTHKDGNILYVIITELDNTYTHSCEVRDFSLIIVVVQKLFKSTRCKDKIEHHKVEHRNLKCVTQSTWREKVSNISIIDNCCITEQAKAFENDLTKLSNEVAPIKNKIVRKRTQKPWFSDNVKAAHLTHRRCVRSWEKSKSEDKWRAVKNSAMNTVNN